MEGGTERSNRDSGNCPPPTLLWLALWDDSGLEDCMGDRSSLAPVIARVETYPNDIPVIVCARRALGPSTNGARTWIAIVLRTA